MSDPCLKPAEFQELLLGSPSEESWRRARAHLASCDICRLALEPLFAEKGEEPAAAEPGGPRPAQGGPGTAGGGPGGAGFTLGPYRVLRRLGGGGQGQVYLAEDVRLSRKVALKVLSAAAAPSASALERFRREALALSRIEHPGICAIYEAGEIDGIAFIAMRFVEGETLGSRIASRSAETPSRQPSGAEIVQTVRLIEKVARALHSAHEQGLVHRDVKPGNIMVTQDGSPVILDFGLVRDESGAFHTLTRSGDSLGTPAYMSPEQIEGGVDLDRRTDVYSLGTTLYQALTLSLPFEAPTREALYRKILLGGKPPDPHRLNPRIPRDLKVVIETAIERDRARRYASALDLAEDLRRACEYEPIRARPAGPLLRLARWTRRNPFLASSTGALFAVLVAGIAVALTLLASVRRERDEKESALGSLRKESEGRAAALDTARAALVRAESRRLAGIASGLRSGNPGLAMLLAVESERTDPNALARNTIIEALLSLREVRTLAPLDDGFFRARPDPAGKLALTGTWDGTVCLQDLSTGRREAVLPGSGSLLECAEFLPDGSGAVLAWQDGTVRLWRRSRARLLRIGGPVEGGIRGIAVSPDGTMAAGAFADRVRIWSTADGRILRDLEAKGHLPSSAEFSSDGTRLLTAGAQGSARVWQVAAGGEPLVLDGRDHTVCIALFRPDGRRVFTLSRSSPARARLWDAGTGALAAQAEGPPGEAAVAALHPEGRWIAIPEGRSAVRIADGETLETVSRIPPQLHGLHAIAASPDGAIIAAGYDDGSIILWSAASGAPVASLGGHTRRVTDLRFLAGGRRLLSAAIDDTARLWSVEPRGEVRRLETRDGPVSFVALSPDGARILTVSGNEPRILDAASGRILSVLRGHDHPITAASFSPDGRKVLTATSGLSARVWSTEDGGELARIEGHAGGIERALFSPRGGRILTIGRDRTVRLWDEAGRELLRLPASRSASFHHAAFSPDGSRFAVSAAGEGVDIRDAAAGSLAARIESESDDTRLWEVLFSPDGKLIALSAWGDVVQLREAATGRLLHELRGHDTGYLSASFSPDGNRLATASGDRTVRLWDVATGKALHVLKGHEDFVIGASFSQDGRRLLSRSRDGTARLWDVESGEEVCTYPGDDTEVTGAALSPCSDRVVLATDGGEVWTYPTDPLAAAAGLLPRKLTPEERDFFEVGSEAERAFLRRMEEAALVWEALRESAAERLAGPLRGIFSKIRAGFGPPGS